MKLRIQHVTFLVGLLSFIFSFLWFGRNQEMYNLLLLFGLLLAIISFIVILVKRDIIRNKIIWTVVLVGFIIINRITEPILIDYSYNIFINSNSSELNLINQKLLAINGDITILKDAIYTKDTLTNIEKGELQELRNKIKVYTITKNEDYIYYGLSGFLDVRLGISYYSDESKIKLVGARKLRPNWYH